MNMFTIVLIVIALVAILFGILIKVTSDNEKMGIK